MTTDDHRRPFAGARADQRSTGDRARGQSNLVALVVALVVVTTVTAGSVVVAEDALSGVDRDAASRRAAGAIADRLVAPGSPTTRRANVLDPGAIASLDRERLATFAAPAAARPVRVRLGNRTVVDHGTPSGATVRRAVLVGERRVERHRVDLGGNRTVVVNHTSRVDLAFRPRSGTTVRTVRADGRPVLHAPSGLAGNATVDLDDGPPTELRFPGTGANGTVVVTAYPLDVDPSVLTVTVGRPARTGTDDRSDDGDSEGERRAEATGTRADAADGRGRDERARRPAGPAGRRGGGDRR